MSNFSYAVKILKAEFCAFMEPLTKGLARPKAKLLYDLVYGILRSGSARVSLIGKALCEQSSINVTENRLTQAIAKGDPMPVAKKLSSLSFSMCPGFVCCDETDIQKPFGKAFECLDDVQDGSAGGRPIGRGVPRRRDGRHRREELADAALPMGLFVQSKRLRLAVQGA